MQDIVDKVHSHMWAFCQESELDIDPIALKRSIARHVSVALLVVAPATLERLGHARLAVMIDVAGRYEVTLAEILNEAVIKGAENSAALCREIHSRKESTRRVSCRPSLRIVK